ncbi:MAG: hypothetical protein JOZ62_18200 [Acidobacteriaceae bacterium]|nr:hypothetical protein [Acidobacteriaceae bacterium]
MNVRDLQQHLASRESESGGWGYASNQFSAESSSLALLALQPDDPALPGVRIESLTRKQLGDGCWPSADPGSPPGNWATALAVNALLHLSPEHPASRSGLQSLVDAKPQEASCLWRLKFRTMDTHVRFDPAKYGWSWVPNAGSWVHPTAMALIALERGRRFNFIRGKRVASRMELGYAMLFDRMCAGGGWNAGNSSVYGVPLAPHVDATAIALLALRLHYGRPKVKQSLSWLLSVECSSAYSTAWRILAMQSYRSVEAGLGPAIDNARQQLLRLAQQPGQIADNSTLALTIFALKGDFKAFAIG